MGPGQDWRRVINAEVDQLVGARAKKLVPIGGEAALVKADALAASVAGFLGRRMQALWSYDKDQGPQVLFPGVSKATASTETAGSSSNRSSFQTRKRRTKEGKTPPSSGGLVASVPVTEAQIGQEIRVKPDEGNPVSKPEERGNSRSEPVANKKQMLMALVDGTRDARGHSFVTTSTTNNNLQIKCEDCGLWIQQVDSKPVFQRKVANFCKNHPLSVPAVEWKWHASHNLCNEGFRWKCTKCHGVQAVGGLTPALLERVCAHGKTYTSRRRAALDSQAAVGTKADGGEYFRRPSKKDRDRLKALGLWPPAKGGKGKAAGSKDGGPDLLLMIHLPGIFAARTRMVGDGRLAIRKWGIRVNILELERLQPMGPEPSSSQILHMAFIILVNKHNCGVRRYSPNSSIDELVVIDGADWKEEKGPAPFPPRRRLESWWKWIEGVDPITAQWLRNLVERHPQDHAELALGLLEKLQASDAGQWVVATLYQQRVLVISQCGDTYICTSKTSAFLSRDWNLLCLK